MPGCGFIPQGRLSSEQILYIVYVVNERMVLNLYTTSPVFGWDYVLYMSKRKFEMKPVFFYVALYRACYEKSAVVCMYICKNSHC